MALVYNEETGNFDDIQMPPIIRYFRLQESVPFVHGDSVTLTWQIDGANHIFIDDEEQNGNSLEVTLDSVGTKQFKVRATNSDGTAERVITLEVLPCPKFEIHPSATVLHKGKNENVVFRWTIENARDIKLISGSETTEISESGEVTFTPIEDTQFVFEAKGLEGNRVFRHIIPIKIREAARIDFKVNRQFSYPNLPIILSWTVENCVAVTIDDFGEQPTQGQIEVTPGVDTTYVIRVQDAFGEERRTITVRMLPLPVIKQILVPTPKVDESFDISYAPPQIKANIPVPTFETSLVKLSIPDIPQLKDSYFVKPISSRKKKRIKNLFKSLFAYFFSLVNKHIIIYGKN